MGELGLDDCVALARLCVEVTKDIPGFFSASREGPQLDPRITGGPTTIAAVRPNERPTWIEHPPSSSLSL